MRSRFVRVVLAACLLALAVPGMARAGMVTDQLSADVGRVFETLGDSVLKANAGERRAAIRMLTQELFDLSEMAARSLGAHWERRTAAERETFTKLLGPLIESHILMLEGSVGAKIDYLGETVRGDRALVRTRVAGTSGRGLSLDYRLVHRGERWLIYDVLIDDVSLVENYRAQFTKIIRAASYEALVSKLATE